METFVIYSRDNCPFCVKIKQFMESKGIPFVEHKLGEDFEREWFVEKFGPKGTFPRIFLEGELIGGMKETVKYLVENRYV